jgi:hypothetical protein
MIMCFVFLGGEKPEAEGRQNWKGKSQEPHQTQKPWRLKGKQPDPLPQQIKPTQNLT